MSPLRPIARDRLLVDYPAVAKQVYVFEFRETAFVVGSDPVVCIATLLDIRPYMTTDEIDRAFSGYATYRQAPWMTRYVGVWGRKNCQRFRRFLRERGAVIVLQRQRPDHLRLTSYTTRGERRRVRSLSELST
jgi:hypothetical protein